MTKSNCAIDIGMHDRFADVQPEKLNEVEQTSLIKHALAVLQLRYQVGEYIKDPTATKDYLRLFLSNRKNEIFDVMFLNNKHRILGIEEMFQGTIDGAAVYPRVLVQRTLEINASALVIFHNHPAGSPEPSCADKTITKRLQEALNLIDVRMIDSIIVGDGGTVSFAERGLL